jgi:UDP-2-acetamido-3-amino-2,3-dideoxy-glucuronate N-acetyltransferase
MPSQKPYMVELQFIPGGGKGALSIGEVGRQVPFDIQRFFLIHDLPQTGVRGNHAHRAQHQFLIATSGTIAVDAIFAGGTEQFLLDRPATGLHVPPMGWISLRAESPGAVCLVLASGPFDEADYIRDRSEFDRMIAK